MIDTPEIVQTARQQAAVLRVTVPREKIKDVMEPGMRRVAEAVAAQGFSPTGPMFAHHLRMDAGTFDFEIGLPVEGFKESGPVKAGELPAARVARTVYRGDYEQLGDAWGEFDQWMKAEGLEQAEDLWEVYLSGPESNDDPEKWETQLNRPLRG